MRQRRHKPAGRTPAEAEVPAADEPAPAPTDQSTAVAEATGPASEKPAEVAPSPAGDEPTAAELPEIGTGITAAPPTVTAPKLENVASAVIIRRGDTLWRISRRVYGRGVRYSTIYLANQDQIEDPDLIWPGQVFTVPKKTEEGETADLERLGDRVTTIPRQAVQ